MEYNKAGAYPHNQPPPQYNAGGYPHPQQHPPGFVPMQQQPQQQPVVVVQQVQPVNVGPDPVQMICPSCQARIVTNVSHEASTKTHLIALCLCLFVCWPCVCLPYCMDSCQNANHMCPNCNAYLGTYQN